MTSEIEEAKKWIGEWIGLSASMIRSGEDFTPTAEEVHKKARASFATILSALTTAQAEVERLTRERDEAREVCSAHLDLEQHWNREYHKAQQRAQAAEARATRAEGLLAEAGEVLGPFAATGEVLGTTKDSAIWAGQKPAPPLTFGHFRAARAFLAKLKEQG